MIAQTLARIAQNQTLIPWMSGAGLIFFLTFFVGMLVWTARPRNQTLYQSMGWMPLDGNEQLKSLPSGEKS